MNALQKTLALCAVLLSSGVQAAIATITHCDSGRSVASGGVHQNHSDGLPSICPASFGAVGDPAGRARQHGEARASAASKTVGVFAESSVVVFSDEAGGSKVDGYMFSDAFARFSDFVRIDARDGDGKKIPRGTLTVNFRVEGQLSVTLVAGDVVGSYARLDYRAEVDGMSIKPASPEIRIRYANEGADDDLGPLIIPDPEPINVVLTETGIPWDGTTPMSFAIEARARALAKAHGAVSSVLATAEFGHTLYWLGITDVADEFGNPVASFTALGEQDIDWAVPAAVPVPAAGWLFGSALAGLRVVSAFRHTRRRRAPAGGRGGIAG